MNGNRSSAYSGVFLALGSLVLAAAAFRALAGFLRVRRALESGGSAARASRVLGPLGAFPARLVMPAAAILVLIVVAISVGALQRRPWALAASVALLGVAAAAGLGIAVFQLSAILRGADRTPDALEVGYGPVVSYWRIASVIVGLLVTIFCAAAVRRLSSEETRREFRSEPPMS